MAERNIAFLDRLAHDLRGPLSPLQTAAYLLKRPDLDPARQRELVDIIDRQSARLSTMVAEIGDWIRAEQDRLVLHREVSPLDMLIELATGGANARSVEAVFAPGSAEVGINGDPQRLVQLLTTLIGYARARQPDGPLRIDIAPVKDGHVEIRMDEADADLPQAMVDELFIAQQPAPFDDGLGLRLILARAIAEAHGGTLVATTRDADTVRIALRLPVTDIEI